MSLHTRQKIQQIFSLLDGSLEHYAQLRDPQLRVGQFLDREGWADIQTGIYGVSGWLLIARESKDPRVLKLSQECKVALRQWVQEACNASDTPENCNPDQGNSYELRYVIPKICYAFAALSLSEDTRAEANKLQLFVSQAQNEKEGGWDYLTDSMNQSPFATALVLRAFREETSFTDRRYRGLDYLRRHYSAVENMYERLYILNTMFLLENRNVNINCKSAIKKTIRELFKKSYYDPTRFTNPLNIDFNDRGRTRYIRYLTDVILLESLILISRPNTTYLDIHLGKRIIHNILQNMEQEMFNKDTSGHRASGATYSFISEVLRLVDEKEPFGIPAILQKTYAWYRCSDLFGIEFSADLLIFLLSFIGTIVAGVIHLDIWFEVLLGSTIAMSFQVIKNSLNLKTML